MDTKLVTKWKYRNQVEDFFYRKRHEIQALRYRAEVMEKIINWLDHGFQDKMQTVLKFDLTIDEDIIKEGALCTVWVDIIKEFKEFAFNMDHCKGGMNCYHFEMRLCSDEEKKEIDKKMDEFREETRKKLKKKD